MEKEFEEWLIITNRINSKEETIELTQELGLRKTELEINIKDYSDQYVELTGHKYLRKRR